MIDFVNVAARKKLGASDDWQWCQVESITGGFLLHGSVTTIGPRTGRPKWKTPFDKVLLTEAEVLAAKAEYERTTGKCSDCEGSGQQMVGFSVGEGRQYRPCPRCGATGVPPA